MVIDPDFGVHIYPVEIDKKTFPRIGRQYLESFAIPPNTAGQGSAANSGRVIGTKRAFDAPIVRQSQRSPIAVIKGR
jgi:hypothetical protein